MQSIENYMPLVFTFFSGTGKTTTLIKMCKENPHLKFLVVCYNRTVADYAKKMFPKKNVECWTAHSLAYRKVVEGQNFSKDWKLCENLKAQDIMSRYCSTGCQVFKGGTELDQKVPNSIFYVKNHPNLSKNFLLKYTNSFCF